MVRELLDDVRHGVGLDQPHHVTMETEDTVHLGKVPVGEPLDERERRDLGVQRGVGDLQSHRSSLAQPGKNSSRSVRRLADERDVGVDPVTLAEPFAPPTGAPVVDTATPTLPQPRPTSSSPPKASLRERSFACRAAHEHRSDPGPSADHRLALPAVRGVVPARGARHVHARWRCVDPAAVAGGAGVRCALEPDRPGVGSVRERCAGCETIVAFAVVPLATAWAALATLNVRRATARRCNPVIAALSIPAAVAGVWAIGASSRGAGRRLGDGDRRAAPAGARPGRPGDRARTCRDGGGGTSPAACG